MTVQIHRTHLNAIGLCFVENGKVYTAANGEVRAHDQFQHKFTRIFGGFYAGAMLQDTYDYEADVLT